MADENQRPVPDTGKYAEQIARAAEASRILDSPIFIGAFEAVKEKLKEGFFNSDGAPEILGRLYLMGRLTDNLRQHFVDHINNGKVANDRLIEIEKANPKPEDEEDAT